MRHLRSILYAIVLAPAVWVLCGVGFTSDLVGRARDGGGVESWTGLVLLLLAGAAYAILVFAPISPAGPLLSGVVFLGVAVWALVSPSTYASLWGPDVSKEGFDLSLPGYGLAALLGVPLVCTALSGRRWERYEPPHLPLIGTLGGSRGVARPAGIPMAVLETAVMPMSESPDTTMVIVGARPQDTTVVVADAADEPTVAAPSAQAAAAAPNDEPTVVAPPVPVVSGAPAVAAPAAPVVPAAPVAPAAPGDEPTVVVEAADEPATAALDGEPVTDPLEGRAVEEATATFAVSSTGEVTTAGLAESAPGPESLEDVDEGAGETAESVAVGQANAPTPAAAEPADSEPAAAEPATAETATAETATAETATAEPAAAEPVAADPVAAGAAAEPKATETASAEPAAAEPSAEDETTAVAIAANDGEADDDVAREADAAPAPAPAPADDTAKVVAAQAAPDGHAEDDDEEKTQLIKLPTGELSTADLRRIPGERPTHNIDNGGRTQVIGPGQRTQIIRRDSTEETQVIRLPGQRTPPPESTRPPQDTRPPGSAGRRTPPTDQDATADADKTQVIRLGTGTVEPPGDRTQVLKLPTGEPAADRTQVLRVPPAEPAADRTQVLKVPPAEPAEPPSILKSERPDPAEDPTTRLVPPSRIDPDDETTVDVGDTKKRIMTVMNLERPAGEAADDTRRLAKPPPPPRPRPPDDDA